MAIASDVHINDFLEYSSLDENGIPSRLRLYTQLAKDFRKFSNESEAHINIIPGDIAHSPNNPPEVISHIREFLEIISKDKPTYIISGNHDINSKLACSDVSSVLHALSKDIPNLIYIHDEDYHEVNGYTLAFKSWNKNNDLPKNNADLFISHGVVSGCSNFFDYIFQGGFNRDELFKRFRLSILGDVHSKQIISDNESGRKILIPGIPIQSNWSDNPDCGFWKVELDESDINLDFTNIHEYSPETYHKFLFVNSFEEIKPSSLSHYRVKSYNSLKNQNKSKKDTKLASSIVDVNKVFEDFISTKEINNKERIKELFSLYFSKENIKNDYYIPECIINSLNIKNFLSITSLHIDFSKLENQTVIVGSTGSGKTSICEAIFYSITGETTKGVSVDLIRNFSSNEDICFVELELNINGTDYKIKRGRSNGKPELILFSKIDGEYAPYNKVSTKETQEYLYKLLNFNDFDIKLFSYFSSKNPVLFNTLKSSERSTVISKILRLFDLDEIREKLKIEKSKFNSEILELNGELRILNSNKESITNKLNSYTKENVSSLENEIRSSLESVNKQKAELVLMLKEASQIDSLRASNDEYLNKIKELDRTIIKKNSDKNSLSSELLKLKSNYKTICEQGACYACGQEIKDDNLKKSLEIQIRDIVNKVTSISTEKDSLDLNEYNKKQAEISKIIREYSDLQSKLISLNKEEEILNKKILEFNFDDKYLDKLSFDLQEISKSLEEKNNILLEKRKEYESLDYIHITLLKKDGEFIKEINNVIIRVIQEEIDTLTSESQISIKIDRDLNVRSNFFGEQLPYENLSNGQSRICDLILMISLNNVFSKLYSINGILGISIFDELISFLSADFIDVAKSLLDKLICNKMFVITHDYRLASNFNNKILVSIDNNGNSFYEFIK